MVTDNQEDMAKAIVNSLKAANQNWQTKQDIRNTVNPNSLNDFEFVLLDLQKFDIIQLLQNGHTFRLTERGTKFKGLKNEYYKKGKQESFRFWLSTSIALIGLIISVWLAFENNELKEELRIQGDRVEALEKESAGQDQMLRLRDEKISRLRNEIDSLKKLPATRKTQ